MLPHLLLHADEVVGGDVVVQGGLGNQSVALEDAQLQIQCMHRGIQLAVTVGLAVHLCLVHAQLLVQHARFL